MSDKADNQLTFLGLRLEVRTIIYGYLLRDKKCRCEELNGTDEINRAAIVNDYSIVLKQTCQQMRADVSSYTSSQGPFPTVLCGARCFYRLTVSRTYSFHKLIHIPIRFECVPINGKHRSSRFLQYEEGIECIWEIAITWNSNVKFDLLKGEKEGLRYLSIQCTGEFSKISKGAKMRPLNEITRDELAGLLVLRDKANAAHEQVSAEPWARYDLRQKQQQSKNHHRSLSGLDDKDATPITI